MHAPNHLCHESTLASEEEEKDIFYDQLDRTYDAIPAYDMKIVLGDFNAKVGKETIFSGTIYMQTPITTA